MANKGIFSYVNWEVVSGYSPLFSKTDHETLKRCDGYEVEDNGHGRYSLRTPIGRLYLDDHIVKNKGDKDINKDDFSQNKRGENLINELLALAAMEYAAWPRNYLSPAYIKGHGFALVSVANAKNNDFSLRSEIHPISHAMQVEMETMFLPSHYRYMPYGTLDGDIVIFVYIMPLFMIEDALISLRPTINYIDSLDDIAKEYNGIFTGETRDKDRVASEYERACIHLFNKFNQSINVLSPGDNKIDDQLIPPAMSNIPKNSQVYDVFISYRRSDGLSIAKKIYSYLTAKGLRVFWDKEEMVNGHYFTSQIQQNVINAPNFLFVGTNDALNFRNETPDAPDYVAEEVRLAFQELNNDPENRIILPILPNNASFAGKKYAIGTDALAKMDSILLVGNDPNDRELAKILKSVTEINRRNLWNAAHRWLYNNKLPGRRFHSLNIDERIMPNVQQEMISVALPIDVKMEEKKERETKLIDIPLREALSKQHKHVYLVGEGGIGKTTALISIMDEAYNNKQYTSNSQIPIFVELSKAPDTYGRLYEGGISTFIRRSIYQQLREDKYVKQVSKQEIGGLDEAFMIDPDVAVVPIVNLLTKQTGSPEYILLLDGLNEISRVEIPETNKSVSTMVLNEIDWMMSSCPNIRIILASRTDEIGLDNPNVTRLYLAGVSNKTIQDYLYANKISASMIRNVFHDKALLSVLRIPLFLSLFSSINIGADASSRGELLKLFFNVRKNNLDVYTAQNRISEVDKDVSRSASIRQKHRIDAAMQCFLLDFIIPEIAWTMVQKSSYRLPLHTVPGSGNSQGNLQSVFQNVLLQSIDDYGICGPVGINVFSSYRSSADARMHTDKIRRTILANLGDDEESSELIAKLQSIGIELTAEQINVASNRKIINITELLLNCAVMSLGVLRSDGDSYEFVHQAFRDYFAAVKLANSFKIAYGLLKNGNKEGAREVLNSLMTVSISDDVLSLTGEYFSENKNTMPFPHDTSTVSEDRLIINSLLSLYRKDYSISAEKVVANFVNILKYSRYDLSCADLSYLDLRACNLIGVRLGNGQYAAKMVGCCLNDQNLFLPGHRGEITNITTDKRNEMLATASSDGVVKVWCIKDQKEILCYSEKGAAISSISFSHNSSELIIGLETGNCTVINVPTGKQIAKLKLHEKAILSINTSTDNSYVILASKDNTISIWKKPSFEFVSVIRFSSKTIVNSEMCTDNDQVFICFTDGHFEIYDYKVQQCIKAGENKKHCIIGGCYASYKHSAIVLCKDQTLGIWDEQTQLFSDFKKMEIQKDFDLGVFYTNVIDQDFHCLPGTVKCDHSGMYVTFVSENKAYIVDILTGKLVNTYKQATAIEFLNDLRVVAIGFEDGTVQICDVFNPNELLFKIKGENRSASCKGYHLYSTSNNLILTNNHVWNQIDNKCIETLEYRGKYLHPTTVSSNGKRMVVENDAKEYEIWSVSPVKYISRIQIPDPQPYDIFLNDDGSVLIAISLSGMITTLYCCDTESGEIRYSKKNSDGLFSNVSINPQGSMLAVTLCNHMSPCLVAKIYDLITGEPKIVLEGHNDDINTIQFSPDGRYIATASNDRTVRIWDANTGKCKKVLSTQIDRSRLWERVKETPRGKCQNKDTYVSWQNRAKEAFFSPDGNYVIAKLGVDLLVVWSTHDWKIVRTIEAGVVKEYSMDLPSKHIATVNGRAVFINSLNCIDTPITFYTRPGSGEAQKIEYSLSGEKIYILYEDGIIDVWNIIAQGFHHEILPDIEGPIVHGCNMTSLSNMSKLSESNKLVLEKFGALVEMEE